MAKAYRRLKDLGKLVAPFPWIDGKHIDVICEHLEAVERGEIKRLIINMPPGYAKSFWCSRCFPVWCLLRHPDWEFLLTSYGDDLAEEHSAAARQFYSHWAPKITGAGVDKRSQAVDRWLVDVGSAALGGGMRACGINSAVTGRRADVAVIDDPFKNWKEASSQSMREAVHQNYQSAVRNRLRPGGRIVIVHNRWHKDDLSGRLINEMIDGTGEDWTVLKLAARAVDSDDPLGRVPGEVLWPDFYSSEEVDAIERGSSHFFFVSQHQQDPEEPEGKLFKRDWLRDCEWEGDFIRIETLDGVRRYRKSDGVCFQCVDTNGSEKTTADYFCCSTFMLFPGQEIAVVDVFRERIGVSSHLETLENQYRLWRPAAQFVENKTFGTSLISAALVSGLPVYPCPADVDKITRAITVMTKYKNGQVSHMRNTPWRPLVDHELLEFPGGKNDDFVDTVSMAGIQSVELGAVISELPTLGGEQREGIAGWESSDSLFPATGDF